MIAGPHGSLEQRKASADIQTDGQIADIFQKWRTYLPHKKRSITQPPLRPRASDHGSIVKLKLDIIYTRTQHFILFTPTKVL
jgi:hypothetical protein